MDLFASFCIVVKKESRPSDDSCLPRLRAYDLTVLDNDGLDVAENAGGRNVAILELLNDIILKQS